MSTLIGALRVSLSADTAQFQAGLNKAKGQAAGAAGSIQKSMGAAKVAVAGLAAGLTVGLFARVIKGALEFAGSLAETAQQLGVTAKDLQTFRYAAGQVGVSQEQLETGLSKLTITLGKVAVGAKEPAKALAAIGLSVDELKGKDSGQAFRLIADGLQKVTDRSQRAAVEVALFGKTGSKLDNLLAGGSAALNKLTEAAEKLGIVLSDEQIQRADETADKLEAVKTVLSANIAGIVADNAESILQLANALGAVSIAVVRFLSSNPAAAIGLMGAMAGGMVGGLPGAALGGLAGSVAGSQIDIPVNPAIGKSNKLLQHNLEIARRRGDTAAVARLETRLYGAPKVSAPSGLNLSKFLAPGGGGKKKGAADHSAEDQLRDEYEFAQQMRRANMDILRAQQDLATDYSERTTIGIDILDAERFDYKKELEYQVELGKLTKGKQGLTQIQADQLQAAYGIKDGLEREKLRQDEQAQRVEDVQKLTEGDFDRRRDILEAQSAIATTASERRAIELELLKIAYEQKKQALQNIVDTSKNELEIENARRDLLNLNQTYGADQQGVKNATRGPLEEWAASVPQTAAQINEALQSIEVQGLDGLSDAISGVITGTESLQEAFGNLAQSIISDIIKMTVKMLIFRAVSAMIPGGPSSFGDFSSSNLLLGDVPAFASGGSFSVLGRRGTDRNVLSMNGLPIARVSHGERIGIGAANEGSGGKLIVELRDELLDARIAQGAGVQIMRTYPSMKADTIRSMKDGNRRRRP